MTAKATARGSISRSCTEGCARPPGDLINWPPVWYWAVGDSRQTRASQAAASNTALVCAAAFSAWNHAELHCLVSAAGFEQGREKQPALNLSGGHLITVLLTWVPSKSFSHFQPFFSGVRH